MVNAASPPGAAPVSFPKRDGEVMATVSDGQSVSENAGSVGTASGGRSVESEQQHHSVAGHCAHEKARTGCLPGGKRTRDEETKSDDSDNGGKYDLLHCN